MICGPRVGEAVFWLYTVQVLGEVLIAGESLFRCEQFFWQTGVEVPFLRPMSTWVNATWLGTQTALDFLLVHLGETWFSNPPTFGPGSFFFFRRYAPLKQRFHGAEVLVHNRGRLKYEFAFLEELRCWDLVSI